MIDQLIAAIQRKAHAFKEANEVEPNILVLGHDLFALMMTDWTPIHVCIMRSDHYEISILGMRIVECSRNGYMRVEKLLEVGELAYEIHKKA